MITLHDAIYVLNPQATVIRGEEAFDKDENPVVYDLDAAQAKLVEMQAEEEVAIQAKKEAKQTAMDKLAKLGLTIEEIIALGIA